MITKIYKHFSYIICALLFSAVFTACSDSYMEDLNKDSTKATTIAPSAQLTTALLQTYGDFGLMDTYRSYITGFTQHFAGGWNVISTTLWPLRTSLMPLLIQRICQTRMRHCASTVCI